MSFFLDNCSLQLMFVVGYLDLPQKKRTKISHIIKEHVDFKPIYVCFFRFVFFDREKKPLLIKNHRNKFISYYTNLMSM